MRVHGPPVEAVLSRDEHQEDHPATRRPQRQRGHSLCGVGPVARGPLRPLLTAPTVSPRGRQALEDHELAPHRLGSRRAPP
eukprot:5022346-Pyramimonas_sp.AAC.1